MVALSQLVKARAAGLEVLEDQGRLIIRGPRKLASLAGRLLESKDEVLLALRREALEAPLTGLESQEEAIYSEDFKIRSARDLHSLWSQPSISVRCRTCNGASWWRLEQATPWTCSRCHPPQQPDAVEWRGPDDPPSRMGRYAP